MSCYISLHLRFSGSISGGYPFSAEGHEDNKVNCRHFERAVVEKSFATLFTTVRADLTRAFENTIDEITIPRFFVLIEPALLRS